MTRNKTPLEILLWSCAAALFLGYGYFAWRMFVNDAFVPDEYLFAAITRHKGEVNETLLVTENTLGYGTAYWTVFEWMGRVSPLPAILSMRLLALVAMLAIPVSLLWLAAKQQQPIAALSAVLLWVTLPMAWWDGKLAGPDIFSYVAAYLGFFLAATKAHWRRQGWAVALGGVLLGIGIGVKPTALVGLVAAVAILMFDRGEQMLIRCGHALRLGAAAFLGFLAANPFFAFSPQTFFRNLGENQRAAPGDFGAHLNRMFFANEYDWDGVYSGGFANFGYSPAAFVLLVALVYWATRKKELMAALLAAFLVSTLLLLSNQRFLGWYWFPFLSLTPFFVAALEFDGAKGRHLLTGMALLVSLLALQSFNNAGTIADAYRNRMEQVRVLASQDEANRCLEENVGPLQNYNAIVALLDPGFKLRTDRPVIGDFNGFRELRGRQRIDAMRARGEPFLLLLSRRLSVLNGLNFDAYKDLEGARFGECDSVKYFAFRPGVFKGRTQ